MFGKTSGFATLVKKEAPQIIVTHCFLHRHALASKTLPSNLQEILSISVKVFVFVFVFCILFIFILHSRESELYRYILDGTSALAWELPFF